MSFYLPTPTPSLTVWALRRPSKRCHRATSAALFGPSCNRHYYQYLLLAGPSLSVEFQHLTVPAVSRGSYLLMVTLSTTSIVFEPYFPHPLYWVTLLLCSQCGWGLNREVKAPDAESGAHWLSAPPSSRIQGLPHPGVLCTGGAWVLTPQGIQNRISGVGW